ncbi:hypothetical protein DFJ73DRAFT_834801 [Zopfochytrium polystomum]|nr:hypothetical protein DFJ73DRAFT_834801 [Zopfochytrium polystomum]
MALRSVFVAVNTDHQHEPPLSVKFPVSSSVEEVKSALMAAANLAPIKNSTAKVVLKLYNKQGALVPIGPHLAPNTVDSPYELQIKISNLPDKTQLAEAVKAASAALADVSQVKKELANIEKLVKKKENGPQQSGDPTTKLAIQRASSLPMDTIEEELRQAIPASFFKPEILEHMKHPTFDIWQWNDNELVALLQVMMDSLGLIEAFSIDTERLRRFLLCVKYTYNENPFHNFRHCFCVTQMMYAIIHVTGIHSRMTTLEKLTLIISTIGHDLDHPGMNNAYQVNANTEYAIIYNDVSPLENHHAAVTFALIKQKPMNFLSNLTDSQFKELRKNVIGCILATDMGKHGEILAKFKSYTDNFSFDDANHRQLLWQMIMKCADISNEVRPRHISEPWVDNLLEEFFNQSDKEKAEGLPTAPFMDREKVTKGSAQVGFIGFVMIPLFELVSKILPNTEEPLIRPIRSAHEYYKSLLEQEQAKAAAAKK